MTFRAETPAAVPAGRDGLVPAVAKAVDIVRHLNGRPRLEASLHALSTELGITKSHCHNIMKTLLAAGWVSYDAQRRAYALAAGMLADISRLVPRQGLPAGLHDELVRLSARIGIPCVLTRVNPDGSFIAVDKAEEGGEFQVSVPVGYYFPPDSTAQFRVRLAWADAEAYSRELAAWRPVRRTPTTIMDRAELEREIRLTRKRGYALSRAEYTPGVTTLAAPIFDAFGAVRLILVVPGVEAHLAPREREVAAELLASVGRINGFDEDGQPR